MSGIRKIGAFSMRNSSNQRRSIPTSGISVPVLPNYPSLTIVFSVCYGWASRNPFRMNTYKKRGEGGSYVNHRPDEGSVSRGTAVATRDLSRHPTKLACLSRDAHPEEPPSATKDLLVSRTRRRVGVPPLPSLSPSSRRCDEGSLQANRSSLAAVEEAA